MFKSLALFAANYLLDIFVLHLIPLAAVATHFHWVYPLVAAISAAFTLAITRYARPLAFSLAALPLDLSARRCGISVLIRCGRCTARCCRCCWRSCARISARKTSS